MSYGNISIFIVIYCLIPHCSQWLSYISTPSEYPFDLWKQISTKKHFTGSRSQKHVILLKGIIIGRFNNGFYLESLLVVSIIIAGGENEGSVKGLRIGLPTDCFGEGLDPEVRQAVLDVAQVLKSRGAIVEEFSLPIMEYVVPCR